MTEENGRERMGGKRVRLLWPRTPRDGFLALLLAVLVLGVVGNLLPEGPREVALGPVRLEVPTGWEAKELQEAWALLSPLEGPKDTFRENLTLLREPLPQPLTAAQYAQVVAWRNAQAVPGFVPQGVAPVRLGGVEAVSFAGEGVAQGRRLEFWVWAFVLGQEGYQITFTGEPGKLAQYRPQVEAAFRLLGGLAGGAGGGVPSSGMPAPQGGAQPLAPGQGWGYPGQEAPNLPEGPGLPEGGFGGAFPQGLEGGLLPPAGDEGLSESLQEHRDFNTWMAEEWSQMLSGETPEPTYQDEAGNLYWEGPSGLLHEWGDYSGE